jgi:hypothetical protein
MFLTYIILGTEEDQQEARPVSLSLIFFKETHGIPFYKITIKI